MTNLSDVFLGSMAVSLTSLIQLHPPRPTSHDYFQSTMCWIAAALILPTFQDIFNVTSHFMNQNLLFVCVLKQTL